MENAVSLVLCVLFLASVCTNDAMKLVKQTTMTVEEDDGKFYHHLDVLNNVFFVLSFYERKEQHTYYNNIFLLTVIFILPALIHKEYFLNSVETSVVQSSTHCFKDLHGRRVGLAVVHF